jgi:hypothetical protein
MNWTWVRMPFGKHRGKPLSRIDDDYLQWLLGECTNLPDYLREAVLDELTKRNNDREWVEDEPADLVLDHPGVLAWRQTWRRMIFLAHPDRGGNEELCKIMNNINDAMKAEWPPR